MRTVYRNRHKKRGSLGNRGRKESRERLEVQLHHEKRSKDKPNKNQESKLEAVTTVHKVLIKIDKHEINFKAVYKEGSLKFSVYI